MPTTQRLFIAVDPPAGTGACAAGVIERLRRAGVRAAWVDPGQLHLTLWFLGEVDEALRPEIVRALDEACSRVHPFVVGIGGVGGFPDLARPRTIWLGVRRGGEGLAVLHRALAGSLVTLGFVPEPRLFHPHVTIGRIRDGRATGRGGSLRAIDGLEDADAGEATVREVTLFASMPRPEGRRHERLHAAMLVAIPGTGEQLTGDE